MESGPEGQRIEKIVVDAPVEHVDLLVAFGRAHRDMAVDHPEVGALDQLHAHLVGQERMLEERRIVEAGRQHRDARRVLQLVGADRRQRLPEQLRIVLDRADPDALEQLGEELHHGLAVFQHVGDAGRRARIVLEHEEFVLAGAHDVDADDVGVDAGRRAHADHLGQESLVVGDQLLGHPAGAQDLLAMVDIVEKGIQRLHPLLDAGRQPPPFGAGNDAGHDVEGDQPLGRFGLAIDGEGDAGLAEHPLGIAHLVGKPRRVLRLQPVVVT